MAYKKQNFVDGQVLKAEHLNHIEEGINNATNTAEKSVSFEYQNLSDAQKKQSRTNIGAIAKEDIETEIWTFTLADGTIVEKKVVLG